MLLESILANLNTTFTPKEFEELLIYFSTSVIRNRSEEELAWDLVENCISKLHFEDCVIYLLDETSGKLRQVAAFGPKNPKPMEIFEPIEIPLGSGITGSVAQSGRGEIIQDTRKDSRYIVDDQERLSELTVPIKLEDQVIGVIDCEHTSPGFFNEAHLQILTAIASISGIKIGQIRADRERREKQALLLRAEEEMLQAKILAIRAQMNPHFLFNALNSIQHFITSDDKRVAMKYISLFGKLVRHYLRHLESDTIPLNDEVSMLRTFMELQELRYGPAFRWDVHCEQQLLKKRIPAYVLHSLIESLIEFIVSDSKKESQLLITIDRKNEVIRALCNFNFRDISPPSHDEFPGKALKTWEQFIESVNKLRHLEIHYEVAFAKAENSKFYNGSVCLKLPVM